MSGERQDLPHDLARLLFEEASDGIFFASTDGVYLAVNESGHRLLGYEQGELVGKRIADVTPAHDAGRVKTAVESVARGAAHLEIWSMLRKDGTLTQLEVLAQLLSNDTILAVVRDLTGRGVFERQIQASEAKLRSILFTAPDIIMSVDRGGRILFINRVLPPHTVDQVVGTSCFDYVPPDARSRVARAIEHVFETRSIDEYEVEGPPGPDGARMFASVRAGPLIEHGTVAAATLCATDVTYRKQAERTRARLEEQLAQAQKMESVGQLAGGVAHDFNNLLTAVGSLVELSRYEGPSPQISEYLDGIQGATARGAALTQQLLAFARKRIVTPEDVEIGGVLTRLAPMVRSLVGEHIQVSLTLDVSLPPVRVDVGSLERVLMNLVVNARDAMPNGGRLTLTTRAERLDASAVEQHPELTPGGYAVLEVADTGMGIAPEVGARLFEPFFTTKPPGAGTGLGLAMCHGIVTQAGGKIAVRSEPGQGATFQVYLPFAPSGSAAPAAPAAPRHDDRRRGRETLLLVEDEQVILQVARSWLTKLGYRVLSASDGVEALEVAAQAPDPIDLLVTDVVMPRLGGRELARRLAELRPATKVLYMSGYAENALAFGGVLSEGINFIQKPYSLDALAARIRQVLEQG
ncbi:MAG TPA: PAS domain S-box protein [Polyangiaceae bacterium]|jgi:PAS domain S-box-containing protein|nr:PAS domain S-box protein [Polyangiaceae bacterium]